MDTVGNDDFDRLPAPYALALRLSLGGASPAAIAEQVGVPVESVPSMLAIAEAKFRHLTHDDGDEQ